MISTDLTSKARAVLAGRKLTTADRRKIVDLARPDHITFGLTSSPIRSVRGITVLWRKATRTRGAAWMLDKLGHECARLLVAEPERYGVAGLLSEGTGSTMTRQLVEVDTTHADAPESLVTITVTHPDDDNEYTMTRISSRLARHVAAALIRAADEVDRRLLSERTDR